jgi:hypothetical protein
VFLLFILCHCAKILSAMYVSLNSDPSDPDVVIKLDISNAFNVLCRRLTLDVLGGKSSCDCACGLKEGDNIETVCTELRNMFSYFWTTSSPCAPPNLTCVTSTFAGTYLTLGARPADSKETLLR